MLRGAKTFTTALFLVDGAYLECFKVWLAFLLKEMFFCQEDALFHRYLPMVWIPDENVDAPHRGSNPTRVHRAGLE